MTALTYSRDALKTLPRMPANTARLIRSKIEQYVADPASLENNVTAMQGRPGHYRLCVGDWRVIFRDDAAIVAVIRIGPRGGVYDR